MADSVSTEAWLDQRRWAALLSYGLYVLLLAGALCSIMLAGIGYELIPYGIGFAVTVALQSYLFSAALSRIRIPHRVMSYCTYGNYTVLRRFRDYDDKSEADRRILEYRATSNNRDGLALAAAGLDLKKRREEHKIIIVFSDGKREGAPETYVGDAAIRDTCFQVRKLRREGAHVIGIFLGEDGELENERMIYGASFLRIRRAEDFAGIAGKRLRETLLNL